MKKCKLRWQGMAIISKFGGGGDDGILWLVFAQQKKT
jgi:hypothetical protein